jgi:hypothetical protein
MAFLKIIWYSFWLIVALLALAVVLWGMYAISPFAFAGALVVTALVVALSRRTKGRSGAN